MATLRYERGAGAEPWCLCTTETILSGLMDPVRDALVCRFGVDPDARRRDQLLALDELAAESTSNLACPGHHMPGL